MVMTIVKGLLANSGKAFQNHKKAIFGLVIIVIAAWSYLNTQAFLNLWLSRDQQGMLLLQQDKAAQAALTFSDENWVAYSFYASGDFEQAGNIYAQLKGDEALFSQANALAHIGQYFKAADIYKALLETNPNNKAVSENLSLMEKIIKNLKKSPGKKTLTNKVDPKMKMNNVESKSTPKAKVQSSQLWLKQVQQNPSKFLRKKFQQEHQNDTK
jgi:tetratricopeptide (TPR) repeat protein